MYVKTNKRFANMYITYCYANCNPIKFDGHHHTERSTEIEKYCPTNCRETKRESGQKKKKIYEKEKNNIVLLLNQIYPSVYISVIFIFIDLHFNYFFIFFIHRLINLFVYE